MSREEELRQLVGDDVKGIRLVDDIIFLEGKLEELRKLPFLRTHPKDPTIQKSTPAAKLYKEMLQQYNNSLRLLVRIVGADAQTEEESPLRRWMNEHLNQRE